MGESVQQEIAGILAGKRRFRGVDAGKFAALAGSFSRPLEWGDLDAELGKIRAGAKADRQPDAGASRRRLLPVLVPAFAAVIALVTVGVFMMTRAPRQVASQARCLFSHGEVMLVRNGESRPLMEGSELGPGDAIVTKARSLADVAVGDGVTVRIRENTRMEISGLLGEGGALDLRAGISAGSSIFTFRRLAKGDRAAIATPTSVAGVRGTTFGVSVREDGGARYEVLEGRISVRSRVNLAAVGASAGEDVVRRIDAALDESAVTVGPGDVCTVSASAVDRIGRRVMQALATDMPVERVVGGAVDDEAPVVVADIRNENATMASEMKEVAQYASSPARLAGRDGEAERVLELSIQVVPESAGVYVDGDLRGSGSRTVLLAPGRHVIEARAGGYASRRIEEAMEGGRRTVSLVLEREKSRFDINRWAAEKNSSSVVSIPQLDMIINISTDGLLEAVTSAGMLWRRHLGEHVTATPPGDGNLLYVPTSGGRIVALSLRDGRPAWSVRIEGLLLFGSGIEQANGMLYAGTSRGYVYAISRAGRIAWQARLDAGVFSTPVLRNQRLYVASQDGNLYRLNQTTGAVEDRIQTGRVMSGSMAFSQGKLFLANYQGEVISYDTERGRTDWRRSTGNGLIVHLFAERGDLYVMSSDGIVLKYDAAGSRVWRVGLGGRITVAPAFRDGHLHIAAGRALYVIDGASGSVRWSYVMGSAPTTAVTVSGGSIIVGTEENGLLVLRR